MAVRACVHGTIKIYYVQYGIVGICWHREEESVGRKKERVLEGSS